MNVLFATRNRHLKSIVLEILNGKGTVTTAESFDEARGLLGMRLGRKNDFQLLIATENVAKHGDGVVFLVEACDMHSGAPKLLVVPPESRIEAFPDLTVIPEKEFKKEFMRFLQTLEAEA